MLALRSSRIFPLTLAVTLGLGAAPARAEEAPSSLPSRWIAALPFGAGQLQRGDLGLGIFFLAGEAILGGASIATTVIVNRLASTPAGSRSPTGQPVNVAALNDEIRTAAMVNRMAFAGWATLTAAGIIEAEASFGPRRRAPGDEARPGLAAMAAPLPGGGLLGVRGRF